MAQLPYPPGSLKRKTHLHYETIQICPAPPGMIGIDAADQKMEVCCLLLQELRSVKLYWEDEAGSHYYRDHPYDPPYETRVVPGFIQTDDGHIWDQENATVTFEEKNVG